MDNDQPTPKWCPYCGLPHAHRGWACSDWCERKIRSWKQTCTAARNRAVKKNLREQQKRVMHRTRWRAVAMGHEVESNLLTTFGVDHLPT